MSSKSRGYKNTTLDCIHKKKLEEFNKYDKIITQKQKKLNDIKPNDKNIHKINTLQHEINSLKNNDPQMEYFDKTGDILIEYYKNKHTPTKNKNTINVLDILGKNNNTNNSNKNELFVKYIKRVEKDNIESYDGKNRVIKCNICGVEKTYFPTEGCFICNECGDMEEVIIDEDYVIKDISCYHRVGRFKEWLNQFQAKESTDITNDIYRLITEEINKRRITDLTKLKRDTIREILRDLQLTKFYDHVPFIINRLNNIPAPKISLQMEKKLIRMFEMIEEIYPLYKTKTRKNMISYSYILHKLFELLEYDELLQCFPLNKSQDVLREQDDIWKKICAHLNWEFYSSFK